MNIKYNYNVSKTVLEEIVKKSYSYTRVLKNLQIGANTHSINKIKKLIINNSIDTTHFTGKCLKNTLPPNAQPIEYHFNSKAINTHRIKLRLIKEGFLLKRCNICLGIEWNGRPIPLELNHIDGDRTNNKLENFEILCPNCHAQTDTYRGRNIKKRINGRDGRI